MEKITFFIHWTAYVYYVYIFGYASLFKIFQKTSMMESMNSLGFNKTWTIWIGIAETIGVLLVLIGLFNNPVKNAGIIFLIPFAVGAFTTHMAHQEYHHYFNSLMVCVLSVVLLSTDKHFTLIL